MLTLQKIVTTFESDTSEWTAQQKLEWLERTLDNGNPEPDENEALYTQAYVMLENKYRTFDS